MSTITRVDTRLRAEYTALTQRAGAIIQPDPSILRVEGPDCVKWLHNLLTVNVETMPEGSAVYALLLEGKAHVLADFVLVKQPDCFLLYTSRAAHENLYANLRRAIFREKVTLTDISDQFGIISIQGPRATDCLRKSFQLPSPSIQSPILLISQSLLIPNPRIPSRFDLLAPHDAISELVHTLGQGGAEAISLDALNILRVETGIPQYPDDFDETTLAPEARLDAFIAPNKGCYPGQETIARIRNLGHVNRLLVQLQITNPLMNSGLGFHAQPSDGVEAVSASNEMGFAHQMPCPGDKIFSDEKEIGEITSAIWSFAYDALLALGYTRREYAVAGTGLQVVCGIARLDATVIA